MTLKSVVLAALLVCSSTAQVTTSQYDNARTGANLTETTLTPRNVNPAQFGKLFSLKVDGDIYAQPLYFPGLEIPGKGKHDVVFVATEHNSVFAFDASGNPRESLWKVSFIDPSKGITTVPASDVRCPFIRPEIGITPTPVIDRETGTLFVLARTKEKGGVLSPDRYVQKLHALAITTGVEKFGGPVEIKASVKGTGAGSSGGQVSFNPFRELPRASLLLSKGHVYLTWASSCDVAPYHGWIISYDAHTLAQTGVFNTTPDAAEGGIWQGDTGPAADSDGNIYLITGNGKFDADSGSRNYGDSVLKIAPGPVGLQIRDYFTPYNQKQLNEEDADLGAGGPLLLPDQSGASVHPHLLVLGGKGGGIYLIDRDQMGRYHPGSDSHAVQMLPFPDGIYSAFAYWNHHLYLFAAKSFLQDFAVQNGKISATPVAHGGVKFTDPGATPTISANGTRDGIAWVIRSKGWRSPDAPAVLYAFEAANVANELYNSERNSARDRAGLCLRFTIPTVAGGRVYVGTKGAVDAFGLLSK